MSVGVDLSVRTLWDQIWAYARFINEAPDDQVREKICSKYTDEQDVLTVVDLMLIFTVISSQIVNAKWCCSLD